MHQAKNTAKGYLNHVQLCDAVFLHAHRQRNSVFFDQHLCPRKTAIQIVADRIVEHLKALYQRQAIDAGLTWN